MNLEQYNKLQQKAEKAKRDQQKALGVLEELQSQLKRKYKCKDLEAAKKKLRVMRRRVKQAETLYEEALEKFVNDYPEFLED